MCSAAPVLGEAGLAGAEVVWGLVFGQRMSKNELIMCKAVAVDSQVKFNKKLGGNKGLKDHTSGRVE